MSTAPRASACAPADVEAWLGELGLAPTERADRESITSWDLVLDGRRRARLRITLILDPSLALICWAHYAPPINDSFRVSYRKLLALERRAPVRQVLDRRGRAPAAGRRDPRRARERGRAGARARAPARRGGPLPRRHASRGSRPAAGRPTRRPRPRSTAPASVSSPATRRTWRSCSTCPREPHDGGPAHPGGRDACWWRWSSSSWLPPRAWWHRRRVVPRRTSPSSRTPPTPCTPRPATSACRWR